jgi:1,4-alpha-glucan branching enzyme
VSHLRATAQAEFVAASAALAAFERPWRHGGSPVLRALADAGAVEILGGPATHPFLPLLDADIAAFALRSGLDDTTLRLAGGHRRLAARVRYSPGVESCSTAAACGTQSSTRRPSRAGRRRTRRGGCAGATSSSWGATCR